MEQLLAYLVGLQIGMSITALYFVVRIAMIKLTPSYIYWIFAFGITGLIYRFIQMIFNFEEYRTILSVSTIIINCILPLSLMIGFGMIYRLLIIKSRE